MKRILAAVALTAALVAGMVGFAQPAAAHTDAQANAVCDWIEVETWGSDAQYVYQLRNASVHLWGRHQASCIYDSTIGFSNGADHVCLLYDFGNGYRAWSNNCLN